jgi:hypothetical protein
MGEVLGHGGAADAVAAITDGHDSLRLSAPLHAQIAHEPRRTAGALQIDLARQPLGQKRLRGCSGATDRRRRSEPRRSAP